MFSQQNRTPFFEQLESRISELGGMFNAHLHLDRAGTLLDKYFESAGMKVQENSAISLHEKHHLIASVHSGPAYQSQDLRERVNSCLDAMIACNTKRADTLVDVTADCVGLSALETLLEIKEARASDIDLRVASYSPLGFMDSEPQRWEVFEKGAELADFMSALPEADDTSEYPNNIGFYEHCRRMILLSQKLNKCLHVHTDQRNEPTESGTEQLIEAVREFGSPQSDSGEPMIWAVHMISPSTYDEDRHKRMIDGLLECNIGVICCPSAAIGMRQIRPVSTPTYNSIPRILELLDAGVFVRLASDNIADICSPSTTANLVDEVFMLSAAVRFYNTDILARLAAGQRLNEAERQHIREHLADNDSQIQKILHETGQAMD